MGHIREVVTTSKRQSNVVVRETEYLRMLSDLLLEWAHGTLKAKSVAERKSTRKRKSSKEALFVASPEQSPFAAPTAPATERQLHEESGLLGIGNGSSDKWMMY